MAAAPQLSVANIDSGNTAYAVILSLDQTTNQFWNGSALEDYNASNWATYVVSLSEVGSIGVYTGSVPTSLPAGNYVVIYFIRLGGSPATTDYRAWQGTLSWAGSGAFASQVAINAKTTNLPSDPADASDIASSFSTVNSTLSTISGKVDAVDDYVDTEVGTLNTNLNALVTTVGVAGAGLTAVRLHSAGLDSIAVTTPTTVASTFPQMVVQLWRRFFKPVVKTATTLKTKSDDGGTDYTTQTISSSAGTETQGAAT